MARRKRRPREHKAGMVQPRMRHRRLVVSAAQDLQENARLLRECKGDPVRLRAEVLSKDSRRWRQPDAVPCLVQLLQDRNEDVRRLYNTRWFTPNGIRVITVNDGDNRVKVLLQLTELTENTRRGTRGLILPAPSAIGSPNESDLLPATGHARVHDRHGTRSWWEETPPRPAAGGGPAAPCRDVCAPRRG